MQPLRILIVDNAISHSKVMRAAMEEVLAALPGGGVIELATTAEEAQCLLTSFQPNAITINFAMSILRIDDTPFVPWLVRTARVPTIAYGLSDVLRDAALATGVDAYFMRPTQRSDRPPFCSKIDRRGGTFLATMDLAQPDRLAEIAAQQLPDAVGLQAGAARQPPAQQQAPGEPAGGQRQRSQRTQRQPRHRAARPRPARRHGRFYHHHRR
mgnify:CR=1 FL=1